MDAIADNRQMDPERNGRIFSLQLQSVQGPEAGDHPGRRTDHPLDKRAQYSRNGGVTLPKIVGVFYQKSRLERIA